MQERYTTKTCLLNQTFNDLTVIARADDRLVLNGKKKSGEQRYTKKKSWLCRCICDTEIVVLGMNLIYGNTKSCGCRKIVDIKIGDIFGKLKVIEKSQRKYRKNTKGYEFTWLCQCECGGMKTLTSHRLNKLKTKSCGCLVGETNATRMPSGSAAFNLRVVKLKKMAKQRNLSFMLTKEQCYTLLTSSCHYCDEIPSIKYKSGAKKFDTGTFVGAGIDRLDNSKGYILENCVSCCRRCNCGKWIQNKEDFLQWIKVVHDKWF